MSQLTDTETLETAPPAAGSNDIISQSEIERLLAQVESVDPSTINVGAKVPAKAGGPELVRRHEFPKVSLYSTVELRGLRMRHDDFITALAARLSIHLGMEITAQMSKLETVSYQTFIDALSNPTHLSVLKLAPLDGTALLDIPPKLGMGMVDRELGGPGRTADETRQIGKIETRLLGRIVEAIMQEWCSIWSDLLEVRAALVGAESNSRFVTTSTPATTMLVLGVEVRMGDTVEILQFAFPHPMLEPLILKLHGGANGTDQPDASAKTAPTKWNSLFDDMQIRLQAELPEIELPAGQVANFKPGDVLTLPGELMTQVRLRLPNHPGFAGTLGIINEHRAVRIDRSLQA